MHSSSFEKVKSAFAQNENVIYSKAPGRINLIGEHTDYNGGLVLPAAVDKYAYFGFQRREDQLVNIDALDINESIQFSLNDISQSEKGWANFFLGNLKILQVQDREIKGFNCVFSSEVPIGGGMSSSSALECGFLIGINELFRLKLSKWDMVNTSHHSNHQFLGLKGGIMDQFSSVFGQKDHVLMLDCSTKQYKLIPFKLEHHTLLLIDTRVSHDLVTSAYNDRVAECHSAVESLKNHFPKIKNLSGVSASTDISHISFETDTIKRRAQFVIDENQRVLQFIAALESLDLKNAGALMYASHDGLSNDYQVSCEELDFLVELFRDDPSVLGSRMMGGGFGGCTINLVITEELNRVKTITQKEYSNQFQIRPKFYETQISEGASSMIHP